LESNPDVIDSLTPLTSDYGAEEAGNAFEAVRRDFISKLCHLEELPLLDQDSITSYLGFSEDKDFEEVYCPIDGIARVTLCMPRWPKGPFTTPISNYIQPLLGILQDNKRMEDTLGEGWGGPAVQAVTILTQMAKIQRDIEFRLKLATSALILLPNQYSWKVSRTRLLAWAAVMSLEKLVCWIVDLSQLYYTCGQQTGDRGRLLRHNRIAGLTGMILNFWPLCQHHGALLSDELQLPRDCPPFMHGEKRRQEVEWWVALEGPNLYKITLDFFTSHHFFDERFPVTRALLPNGVKRMAKFREFVKTLEEKEGLNRDPFKIVSLDRELKNYDPSVRAAFADMMESDEDSADDTNSTGASSLKASGKAGERRLSGKRVLPEGWKESEKLAKEVVDLLLTHMLHYKSHVMKAIRNERTGKGGLKSASPTGWDYPNTTRARRGRSRSSDSYDSSARQARQSRSRSRSLSGSDGRKTD